MKSELSRADVINFYDLLRLEYGTEWVEKKQALSMDVLGSMLDVITPIKKEDFLNRYATTIGKTIYAPYSPGDESHSLWGQIKTIAHEHQHVQQGLESYIHFALKYLFDRSYRALCEAEAYRVNIELNYWRYGKKVDPDMINHYVDKLPAYGIDDDGCDVARTYLRSAAFSINAGGVGTVLGKKTIVWLNEHCPGIRVGV